MASLPQFSVLVVILGLHITSVISYEHCHDLFIDYWCTTGSCCYGMCCIDGYHCCGDGICCNNLSTGAIVGIIVGSAVFVIALISGITWLCCKASRRNGRVVTIPTQYVQQPYLVNPQYEVMTPQAYPRMDQQPYPTQVHYPTNARPEPYIPPSDYDQQQHSIPRTQY